MSIIRSLPLPPRAVIALTGIVLAGLLAAALLMEPPVSGDRTSTGGSESARPTFEVRDSADGSMAMEAEVEASRAGDVAAPGVAGGSEPAVGAAGGDQTTTLALPQLDARIIRSGQVELRVKRGDFEDAWSSAQSIAGAHGGYVVAASRSGADDGPRAGTITMRIPSGRFDGAVDRLRDLSGAQVRRLDVSSQDVTQEFVDVRSRLRHDRAVEARLVTLLAQTKGVSEVLAVQTRLDQVQEQIELSKGRLDYLGKMTSMSTLEAVITAPAASGERETDEPGVLAESLTDAKDRFLGNVAGVIVWLGGALPALIVLAIAAIVARIVWNRTRNSSREQAVSE